MLYINITRLHPSSSRLHSKLMVAIKILRAKEEEEENVNSVARGHSSSKSAVFLLKISNCLHF